MVKSKLAIRTLSNKVNHIVAYSGYIECRFLHILFEKFTPEFFMYNVQEWGYYDESDEGFFTVRTKRKPIYYKIIDNLNVCDISNEKILEEFKLAQKHFEDMSFREFSNRQMLEKFQKVFFLPKVFVLAHDKVLDEKKVLNVFMEQSHLAIEIYPDGMPGISVEKSNEATLRMLNECIANYNSN